MAEEMPEEMPEIPGIPTFDATEGGAIDEKNKVVRR
jgi:hypothetical protein